MKRKRTTKENCRLLMKSKKKKNKTKKTGKITNTKNNRKDKKEHGKLQRMNKKTQMSSPN